jgi:putative tricarboxylic transport membrane protein
MEMKSRDFYSSLFWLALGVGVCYGGYDLELGTLHDPGSGFMFFWVGLIMVGLSLAIFVQGLRKGADTQGVRGMFSGLQWRKIIYVLVALSLYAYFFSLLGFILATILLLVFLFKAIEPQRWSVAILGAVASSVVAYLVFQVWLGSQLPKGFLDIG